MTRARWLILPLVFVGVFAAFGFASLARLTYLTDSELWTVNVAFNLEKLVSLSWVWTRILLFTILHPFLPPSMPSAELFLAARGVFAALGIALVIFTMKFFFDRVRDPRAAFAVGLLTLLNPYFLHQGFRIRADLLVMTLLMAGLALKGRARWFFFFLAAFATPKAVVFMVVLLPLYLGDSASARASFRGLFGARVFLPLAFIVALSAAFASVPELRFYLVHSLSATNEGPGALSTRSFYYLGRLFELAPGFGLLLLAKAAAVVARWKKAAIDPREMAWSLSATFAGVALLLTPERVPFFIVNFLPFLTAWGFTVIGDLKVLGWSRRRSRAIAVVVAIGILAGAPSSVTRQLREGNAVQLAAIESFEKFLVENGVDDYYDGIGLVPSRQKHFQFVGPHEAGNKFLPGYLLGALPRLIVSTRRQTLLEPELSRALKTRYQLQASGLWVPHFLVTSKDSGAVLRELAERAGPFVRGPEDQVVVELVGRRGDGGVDSRRVSVSYREAEALVVDSLRPNSGFDVKGVLFLPRDFVGSLVDLFAFDGI